MIFEVLDFQSEIWPSSAPFTPPQIFSDSERKFSPLSNELHFEKILGGCIFARGVWIQVVQNWKKMRKIEIWPHIIFFRKFFVTIRWRLIFPNRTFDLFYFHYWHLADKSIFRKNRFFQIFCNLTPGEKHFSNFFHSDLKF